MNNLKFGIIQGRLTESPANCLQWFPQDKWEDEFEKASLLGISFIELIAEINHNPNNPIWTDTGISQIKKLSLDNKLTIHTLCNDYIIENSIHDEKTIKQNLDLLDQCKKLGVKKYIMPFFNKSEINPNNLTDFIEPLTIISNVASKYDIEISLETILTGKELLDLLNMLNLDNIKVVYEYDKGVKASYTCLTSNAMEGYRIMVMGDKGTLTIYQDQAWFYPEGKYNASYGEVDGVSGATVGWTKGKGVRLDLKHLDPTAQALTDFKDSILNNTNPLSGIITGAKAAYAVEMGIKAMDTNKVTYWDNINYKL